MSRPSSCDSQSNAGQKGLFVLWNPGLSPTLGALSNSRSSIACSWKTQGSSSWKCTFRTYVIVKTVLHVVVVRVFSFDSYNRVPGCCLQTEENITRKKENLNRVWSTLLTGRAGDCSMRIDEVGLWNENRIWLALTNTASTEPEILWSLWSRLLKTGLSFWKHFFMIRYGPWNFVYVATKIIQVMLHIVPPFVSCNAAKYCVASCKEGGLVLYFPHQSETLLATGDMVTATCLAMLTSTLWDELQEKLHRVDVAFWGDVSCHRISRVYMIRDRSTQLLVPVPHSLLHIPCFPSPSNE